MRGEINKRSYEMGLDVYLYKCPDRALADAKEAEAEVYSTKLWDKHPNYEDFSEDEKAEIRALTDAKEKELGFGDYQHASRQKIEIDSAKYPEHYFKIGYFRSSYNGSGFNHIMQTRGFPTIYDIFGVEGEGDDTPPDWEASRVRCLDAIERYGAFLATPAARWHVTNVTNYGSGPKSETEALEVFANHFNHDPFEGDSYSNREGLFFPGGVKVLAALPGKKYGGYGETYLILDSDPSPYYMQALDIMLETIDYVLAQPDKEQYYLSWSG